MEKCMYMLEYFADTSQQHYIIHDVIVPLGCLNLWLEFCIGVTARARSPRLHREVTNFYTFSNVHISKNNICCFNNVMMTICTYSCLISFIKIHTED